MIKNLATGVVISEWIVTVGEAIGLIWYLTYFGENSEVSEGSVDPTTILIWASLGTVAFIILNIFLAALLTRGVSQKSMRYLSTWIIIQYVLFVISFIIVIANVVGFLGFRWFLGILISLVYRFCVLKIISEFNQQLSLKLDIERRKTNPPPPSVTNHNTTNLYEHNLQQQYMEHPSVFHTQQPYIPMQLQQEYIPPQQQQLSTLSLSQPYHPQPPPFPPRLGRSYSESTV